MDGPCSKCVFPLEEGNCEEFTLGDIPLMYAAQNGHEDCLIKWIEAGADVNTTDDKGATALCKAASEGRVNCVNKLIEVGASVNTADTEGDTALFYAARFGREKCIEHLIQAGADVNTKNSFGITAVMTAVGYRYEQSVRLLIEAGAVVNFCSDIGPGPLMIAASQGHLSCVELLLQEGADVNMKDKDGKTALMYGIISGNIDCAELLIKAGASVNDKANHGETALLLAAVQNADTCVSALIQGGADVNNEPLVKSAMYGNYKCVDLLVKAGADVNSVSKFTPLLSAVLIDHKNCENNAKVMGMTFIAENHSHKKCIDILLNAGADVNTKVCNENHIYFRAVRSENDADTVNITDPNLAIVSGCTALHKAAENNHPECIELLVQAGADVNLIDNTGSPALYYAATNGHDKCVELLTNAGAKVDEKDGYGFTSLMAAAANGHNTCVQRLLQSKADFNAENTNTDQTALTLAAFHGHHECLDSLIKAGAEVNLPGGEVLLAAAAGCQPHCVKIIIASGVSVNGRSTDFGACTPLISALGMPHQFCRYNVSSMKIGTHCDGNHNHEETVKELIEAGADVNDTINTGDTALIKAAENDYEECVLMLLRAGAEINRKNNNGKNAIEACLASRGPYAEEITKILHAAGETIDPGLHDELQKFLDYDDTEAQLKNMCRETIRKHLVNMNPHQHLFTRIPQLGLPNIVTEYLLYNTSLENKSTT